MNARSLAITRAVAVIGGTGALIIGATFAASSVGTVSLTNNTLTAQTGLQIAADVSNTPGTYGATLTGFPFAAAVGQNTAASASKFWLKNTTGAALVAVNEVALNITGFANMDKTKVEVHVKRAVGGTDQFDNLAHLNSTGFDLTGTNLPDETHANGDQYLVWVTLDSGAINPGFSSSSGQFDLTFTGNQ